MISERNSKLLNEYKANCLPTPTALMDKQEFEILCAQRFIFEKMLANIYEKNYDDEDAANFVATCIDYYYNALNNNKYKLSTRNKLLAQIQTMADMVDIFRYIFPFVI